MGLDSDNDGQTPLDENESEGLLIHTITTRDELDEFEQQNIESAIRWTLGKKFKKEKLFTERFVQLVHWKMFGDVWAWAGEYRKTNKNLGADWFQIPTQLKVLLDDCKAWVEHHSYSNDEIAVRFKHRIVQIHCFSNGNGRHSRLMGDLIIEKVLGDQVFTWGANADLTKQGKMREEYLDAVKAADKNYYEPLIQFARK